MNKPVPAPRWGLSDIDISRIPEDLKRLPYWLTWRLEWRQNSNGEWLLSKTPKSIHGNYNTSIHNLKNLGSVDQAFSAAKRFGQHGIGFSFIPGCGLIGLDFDDCVKDGALHKSVAELVDGLGYAEYSPSGTGIKVWARADIEFQHKQVVDFPSPGIKTECYDKDRYFTVTSQRIDALSQEVR